MAHPELLQRGFVQCNILAQGLPIVVRLIPFGASPVDDHFEVRGLGLSQGFLIPAQPSRAVGDQTILVHLFPACFSDNHIGVYWTKIQLATPRLSGGTTPTHHPPADVHGSTPQGDRDHRVPAPGGFSTPHLPRTHWQVIDLTVTACHVLAR
jgi:hypothetical protein